MVEFDKLEMGKWYIKVDTGLDYNFYNKDSAIEKILIIGKGTYFPIKYNDEVDTTRSYDVIDYLNQDQKQGIIDTHNKDFERYNFFDIDGDIKKEINALVESYKNCRLYELEQQFDNKRSEILKEVEAFENHLLTISEIKQKK